MPTAEEIENRVIEAISRAEEELGLSGAVVFVDGTASCSQCIRIEVSDPDSFTKAVVALLRQGIATGALPIIVVKRRTTTSLSFYALDIVNNVMVTLELEMKY